MGQPTQLEIPVLDSLRWEDPVFPFYYRYWCICRANCPYRPDTGYRIQVCIRPVSKIKRLTQQRFTSKLTPTATSILLSELNMDNYKSQENFHHPGLLLAWMCDPGIGSPPMNPSQSRTVPASFTPEEGIYLLHRSQQQVCVRAGVRACLKQRRSVVRFPRSLTFIARRSPQLLRAHVTVENAR